MITKANDDMKRLTSIYSLLFCMLLVLSSCGSDDSSGVGGIGEDISGEEPTPPTLEHVELDLSIFESDFSGAGKEINVEEKTLSDLRQEIAMQSLEDEFFTAHEQASLYAMMSNVYIGAMSMMANVFFQQSSWGEGSTDGDTWVWEYEWNSQDYYGDIESEMGDEFLAIRVTSVDSGPSQDWELRYTYYGTDEEDVDNALLISAQVLHDGTGGAWQIHDLFAEEGIDPEFNLDYDLDGEKTTRVDLTISEESGNEQILYEYDEEEAFLSIDHDSEEEILIEWNPQTGTGSIIAPDYAGGERACWDENFENTDC